MTAAPSPAMWLGRAGLAVGWQSPLGPAVAWLETWAREVPRLTALLGTPGAHRAVTPAPWLVEGGLVVFWCEDEGAFGQRLEPSRARASAPRLLLPGVERLALAAGADGATLFGADAGGVVRVDVDAHAAPTGEVRRTPVERQAAPLLAATRLRDESVLVLAYRGTPSLGVLSVRGGDEVRVKHPLREPCEDLAVSASGGRAMVALGLPSGAVQVAQLGADGVMVERPHAVLERQGALYDSPRVVFSEDDWTLLARDRDRDRLFVHPLGSRGASFALPDCREPFAAGYWARHFFALEATPSELAVELRLWRCARDGSAPEHRVLALALPDAPARRVHVEARATLLLLADRVARGRGYRDEAPRAEVLPDGVSLTLADRDGSLSLAVRAEALGVRLAVASALGEDARAPDVQSTLARLARWVEARVSSAGRAAAARERGWGTRLAEALDGRLLSIERSGPAVVLDLWLERVPTADVLAAWLRRLRVEQSQAIGVS